MSNTRGAHCAICDTYSCDECGKCDCQKPTRTEADFAALTAEVERLKGELADANYWRKRHCQEAVANGEQSQENWRRARWSKLWKRAAKARLLAGPVAIALVDAYTARDAALSDLATVKAALRRDASALHAALETANAANEQIADLKAELRAELATTDAAVGERNEARAALQAVAREATVAAIFTARAKDSFQWSVFHADIEAGRRVWNLQTKRWEVKP